MANEIPRPLRPDEVPPTRVQREQPDSFYIAVALERIATVFEALLFLAQQAIEKETAHSQSED